MSPIKSRLDVEIDRTTMNLIKRLWPSSGMSKNQYVDLTLVKGARYDSVVATKNADIARLKGIIKKMEVEAGKAYDMLEDGIGEPRAIKIVQSIAQGVWQSGFSEAEINKLTGN